MNEPEPIAIRGDVILLGQLLKITGYVHTGGETKELLRTSIIEVNGEREDRRGRQLRDGDVVDLPDRRLVRIVGENAITSG